MGLDAAGARLKPCLGRRDAEDTEPDEPPVVTTGLYLLMGWLIVIAAPPLSASVPAAGLQWLIAGGLAYTGGVVFFALGSRQRYAHFIWHLFVIAGSACHYFAVLGYAA